MIRCINLGHISRAWRKGGGGCELMEVFKIIEGDLMRKLVRSHFHETSQVSGSKVEKVS